MSACVKKYLQNEQKLSIDQHSHSKFRHSLREQDHLQPNLIEKLTPSPTHPLTNRVVRVRRAVTFSIIAPDSPFPQFALSFLTTRWEDSPLQHD